MLEGVYEGLNEDGARKAFKECGYAPLADYVGKGHGGVLRGYAERALVELADGTRQCYRWMLILILMLMLLLMLILMLVMMVAVSAGPPMSVA